MQAAYLISDKSFTEKQVGLLFLVYGISQFLCLAPAGYFLDYSNQKIKWVMWAGCATAALTIISVMAAKPFGEDMFLMLILKVLQGGITAILPPGFNGITLGIVGSTGFTHQVSRNRMMTHIGTALVVAIGSLIAYYLYPNIGHLFIVSPLAAIGMFYNLSRIKPGQVHKDAARGLIITSPTMTEYEYMDDEKDAIWIASGSRAPSTQSSTTMADLTSVCGGSSPTKYVPPDVFSNREQTMKIGNGENVHHGEEDETTLQPHTDSMHSGNTSQQPAPVFERPRSDSMQSGSTSQPPTANSTFERPRSDSMQSGTAANDSTNSSNPSFGAETMRKNPSDNPKSYSSFPSFRFGWNVAPEKKRKAQTFLTAVMDPSLMIFSLVIFFFHLANSSVLPLVMQSLALQDPQAGILLSGLCILIAQAFMAFFAKICGDYSPIWGRKSLTLMGLFSLTIRCFLLTFLVSVQDETEGESYIVKMLILSTQILDSVGAGIIGTLHILVTNDISGGTGRFSLMLGITTGAMCLGGTVSGYIGQSLASDYGYPAAFSALGMISLLPFFLYALCMPETLPDYARPKPRQRRKRLLEILKRLNARRKQFQDKLKKRVGRKKNKHKANDDSDNPENALRPSPQTELV